MMEFDETKAIEFMRARLPEEWRDAYDSDQLLNVIDIIWDFYEDSGLLDIDSALTDDNDPSVTQIVDHVAKVLSKDKGSLIKAEHVSCIVEAEIAYEASIGMADV